MYGVRAGYHGWENVPVIWPQIGGVVLMWNQPFLPITAHTWLQPPKLKLTPRRLGGR